MGNLNFDASKHAPSVAMVCLPPGWYQAMIVATSVVPTSAGTGTLLKLTYEIVAGQHKGRKIFSQLNIKNPNPVAQQIGESNLSAICGAIALIQVLDSQLLHNKPMDIKLKVKLGGVKDQNTGEKYDDSNEVNGWDKLGTHTGGGAVGSPVATTAAPPPVAPPPAAPNPAQWKAPAGQAMKAPDPTPTPAPVQQAAEAAVDTSAEAEAPPPWAE